MFRLTQPQHIALRWSAKQFSQPLVYKHLAPLEPEHRLRSLVEAKVAL